MTTKLDTTEGDPIATYGMGFKPCTCDRCKARLTGQRWYDDGVKYGAVIPYVPIYTKYFPKPEK